jgi:hypothetical protein
VSIQSADGEKPKTKNRFRNLGIREFRNWCEDPSLSRGG